MRYSEYPRTPVLPRNRMAVASVLLLVPPFALWALGAVSYLAGVPFFSAALSTLRAILPFGIGETLVIYALPLAALVLGTASRMMASRRGLPGDFLGFVSVALGTVLLPAAVALALLSSGS